MKTLKKPVLQCFLIDNKKQVKAWCPYCNQYHIHGVDRNLLAGELSHRVAHCVNEKSPFKHGGYYLKIISAS